MIEHTSSDKAIRLVWNYLGLSKKALLHAEKKEGYWKT